VTGLPKKYAKMGFKKGWAAFKKTKGKKKKSSSSIKKVRTTMVKRRRGRPKKASSETSMFGKVLPLLAPIAYGAIREKTSDMLASIPALQKLPLHSSPMKR
jgi:hypothetical protein